MGCQTWPDSEAYKVCHQCGEPTRRYRGVEPLTPAEAESLVKHLDFEAFYDEWCVTNGLPHD